MSRGQRAAVAFVLLLLFCVLCVSCEGQRRQAGQGENAAQSSRAAFIAGSPAGVFITAAGFDTIGGIDTV